VNDRSARGLELHKPLVAHACGIASGAVPDSQRSRREIFNGPSRMKCRVKKSIDIGSGARRTAKSRCAAGKAFARLPHCTGTGEGARRPRLQLVSGNALETVLDGVLATPFALSVATESNMSGR